MWELCFCAQQHKSSSPHSAGQEDEKRRRGQGREVEKSCGKLPNCFENILKTFGYATEGLSCSKVAYKADDIRAPSEELRFPVPAVKQEV